MPQNIGHWRRALAMTQEFLFCISAQGPCGCSATPEAGRGRKDADEAVKQAREIGQAATYMYALVITPFTYLHCGDYETANAQLGRRNSIGRTERRRFWKAGQ